MPKAVRPSTNTDRRQAPYSVGTTVPIAPGPRMAAHTPRSPSHIPAVDHDPKIWSHDNDEKLIRARAQGLNWQPIADKYFPNKSANACRKRHERLMDKRRATDTWQGPKIEALAQAYYEVHEQMWQILADRVGEKWQDVENKCMERGLRDLRAAERTASRRQRQQLVGSDLDEGTDSPYHPQRDRSGSHQDGFNDSGLGNDPEHQYLPSNNNGPQRSSYASSLHNEPAQYSAETSTPPTNSNRSYSLSSSNGYTSNILNTSPYQTIHQSLPFTQPQPQTLPSFSTTFGLQSSINRHLPQQDPAVTTH